MTIESMRWEKYQSCCDHTCSKFSHRTFCIKIHQNFLSRTSWTTVQLVGSLYFTSCNVLSVEFSENVFAIVQIYTIISRWAVFGNGTFSENVWHVHRSFGNIINIIIIWSLYQLQWCKVKTSSLSSKMTRPFPCIKAT